MSTTALIIIIFGCLIALTRGPLIVAPGKTRDVYLRLFATDGRMRLLGVVFAVISASIAWSMWGVPGSAAQAISYFALFILVLPAGSMMLLPGPMQKFATTIWGGFGEGTLRVMGLLAVILGAWLVYYGMGL